MFVCGVRYAVLWISRILGFGCGFEVRPGLLVVGRSVVGLWLVGVASVV